MMKDRLVKFRDWECQVAYAHYANGNTAIQLFDKDTYEPIATATVNPGFKVLPGYIVVKDYAENAGMLVALTKAGIVHAALYANPGVGLMCMLTKSVLDELGIDQPINLVPASEEAESYE